MATEIKTIEVFNEEKFLRWRLNVQAFYENYGKNFPFLSSDLSGVELYEIEDLNLTNFSALEFAENLPCVCITFRNGNKLCFNYKDIAEWSATQCEAYNIFHDNKFIYFIIITALHQAGALGIWNIKEQRWIFRRCEVGLCIDAIMHIDRLKCFIGRFEWSYPIVSPSGSAFFIIKENMEYSEIELEPYSKAAVYDENLWRRKNCWASENEFIAIDKSEKILCYFNGSIHQYFKIEL